MSTLSIVVHVKRRFKGFVSVRDYVVEKTLQSGRDLVIELDETGQQMTIPHEQIMKRVFKTTHVEHLSKFSGTPYNLLDFSWKPDLSS